MKAVLYFYLFCKLFIDNIPTFVLSLLSFIIKKYFFLAFHSLQRGMEGRQGAPCGAPHGTTCGTMARFCEDWQQELGAIKAGVVMLQLVLQLQHKTRLLAGAREGCLELRWLAGIGPHALVPAHEGTWLKQRSLSGPAGSSCWDLCSCEHGQSQASGYTTVKQFSFIIFGWLQSSIK